MKRKQLFANCIFLLLAFQPVSAQSVSNGLIGLWHLDGNATDASGNGHNGTIAGTVTQTTGKFNQGYQFDGSSWIDCGNVDLNSTGEFSVSAWVKSTNPYVTEVWRMVVSKLDYNEGGPLELYSGDGRTNSGGGLSVNYLAWDGGTSVDYVNSPYDLTKNARDGAWHHVAVTFKSGAQIIYFDGVEVANSAGTDPLPNTNSTFRIGGTDFGPYHHPWVGDIDEVAAYNRALSPAEIQTLSQTAATPPASNWSLAGNSDATATSRLGTTAAVPLNLTTNNLTRLRIDADGRVGIGTASPQQLLHVEGPSLQNFFVSTSPLSNISGSGMVGYTKFLPTALGQRLGYFLMGSRGGAENNYNAVGVVGYAAGAWAAGSSYPAYLTFETTPALSTKRQERMRIASSGSVGIGTASPQASALLDLTSTVKGLLVPRMTEAQRNGISAPAQGLLIFQTDGAVGFYYYDSRWKMLSSVASAAGTTIVATDNNALQELKTENEKLRQEMAELKQTVAAIKSGRTTERGNATVLASLEQNAPNPFNSNTNIRYTLPQNTRSASLVIMDARGMVVKTIVLNNAGGTGQVALDAGALATGSYTYTLYVDNKAVDSKQLVVTR